MLELSGGGDVTLHTDERIAEYFLMATGVDVSQIVNRWLAPMP